MTTLFVRHDVEDFATWRSGYDQFESLRAEHGVREAAIYRSADDGNDVTVTHTFDSIDAARSFAGSAELKEAMQTIGVRGAPQIWFAEKA